MNLLQRFILCVSSCVVCFSVESVFGNASSFAATEIAVRYGLLEQSVKVADIRQYAETQKASSDLQSFLNYLDPDTQKELYDALQVKMSLNIAALDKTLDTKPAQQLLSTVSAGIARRDNAGIQALRGAVILASTSKDGLGIVSFLEVYPSDKLVINVPTALEIASQVETLFSGSEMKPGQDNLSASPVWQTEVQYQIFASRGKQFSGCLFGDSVSAELGNSLGEGNFNFALNGLSAISLSQQLQLLAPSGVKCQKMAIAVGGNDAWYKLSDETFIKNLRSSIAIARQMGTKEIFLIPGFYSTDAASHDPTISATNPEVGKINVLINQVASQENIPVVAKYLQVLNENNALKQEYSSSDGAHLNEEGITSSLI
ncbi:lysophospholipase [Calothrix sp. HK-06]|nr:lysophospholipase [Calothrix sp. HK-06]